MKWPIWKVAGSGGKQRNPGQPNLLNRLTGKPSGALSALLGGLLIWCLTTTSWAQPTNSGLSFEHILPDEVSSIGYINDINQDQQGFMWFAGANGLARYDGYELSIYRHNPENPEGLNHSYVNRIVNAEGGGLWLATRQGINLYDPTTNSFESFSYPEQGAFGSSVNDVRDILVDDQGILWIASRGGFLRLNLATEKYQYIALAGEQADQEASLWSMVRDSDGIFWLGSHTKGVYRYDPATGDVENFRLREGDPTSIGDNDVRSVYQDQEQRVWFGTYNGGLARFDRQANEFVRYPNRHHEKSTTVWAILQDSQDQFWVGDGSAINRFDPQAGTFEAHSYIEGVPSTPGNHVINAVFEDRTGDIWLGFFPAGIDRLNRTASAFKNYSHNPINDNSITDGGVVSTLEDDQGNLWIGTGYGLNYWDRESGEFTRITRDEGEENTLSGNTILALEKQDDILWLGIWSGGLNRMNLSTGEIRHYMPEPGNPRSPPGAEPWDLQLDSKGNLWLATEAGVARYNPDTDDFTTFQPTTEQLGGDQRLYSRVVYEDSRGNIWVGGLSGLFLLDQETGNFTQYYQDPEDPNSLSANFVVSLYEDSRGYLWVGSDGGGLNRFDYDTQNFTAYTSEDGLPDDSVTSIVEDEQGDLWLSTHKGLSRFEVEEESFHNFNMQHGLGGNLYNRNTGLKTQQDEILFGSSKGFVLFKPEELEPNPYPPPVVLTGIQILNQPLELVPQPEGPARSPVLAETLTLSPDQSVVTFVFSALNYRTPEDNHYAYRLLGFDSDWNWVRNKRSATYTNLDPGNYTFEVQGSNNDRVWSEAPAQLKIVVLPPVWQTWWAYTLYGLALLAVIGWLIHNQRQKLAQERLVVKRLQQVDKLKDEFLANTSHELRTPLNGIIGLAESLLEGATGSLPQSTKFNLAMIVSSGKRLASLVDDILDFAKLRNQSIALNRRPIDLHVVVEVVLTLTRPLLGNKPVALINDVPSNLARIYADEDRLLQILHNLVGNAVKFTERGQISVSARELEGKQEVSFTISDTGIGIAEHEFEHLFDSFRQVRGDSARLYGGTGLGLSITHKLINLHGGRLEVASKPNEGSSFTVVMPSAESAEQGVTNMENLSPQPALSQRSREVSDAVNAAASQVMLPETVDNAGAHILVVDDEPVNRQVLVNYLALGHFRVSECDSGEAALAFVEKHPDVDLVLLDIMMPNLSGYETCRALRERYTTLELPVIFLTAQRQLNDLLQAFAAGGNDFLSKPFSKDELLARVNTHLQFLDIHRNLELKVDERTSELNRINQGLAQAQKEIENAYEKLEQASLTDPLTGLHNRRYINQHLPPDISLTLRNYRKWLEGNAPRPIESDSVFLLLDIDHFKTVNDTYGHAAGDQVLEDLSQVLRSAMRDSDYLVRWGGEEFLLVGRFSTREEAPVLAERVRLAVNQAEFKLPKGQILQKTCSIGYAVFPFYARDPEQLTWEQVIDTADRALYAAKRAGRNCWVSIEEGEKPPQQNLNPGTSDDLEQQIERGELSVRSSGDPKTITWQ